MKRDDFVRYRRRGVIEARPYLDGEELADNVSLSRKDFFDGSPKCGDMIARNPENHEDQWLVAAAYFAENYEPIA